MRLKAPQVFAALCLGLIVVLFALVMPIQAATPTPTATLRPILPTPTSQSLFLRITPTPLNIVVNTVVPPFEADGGPMADTAINVYRFFNRDHLFDFVGTAVVAMAGVGLLFKMAGRATKDE